MMKEVKTVKTKAEKMKCLDNQIILYTPNKNFIRGFDTTLTTSTVIPLKYNITDIFLTANNIFTIGTSKIEKYKVKEFKHQSTLVIPNTIGYLRLNDGNSLIFRNESVIEFDSSNHLKWKKSYKYIQAIEEYVILVFEETVNVYKSSIGEIYSSSIEDFEKNFYPIFRKMGEARILKKISFSINNKKIYLLVEDKIVGRDLNVYLSDLKTVKGNNPIKDTRISKFQCVSGYIILFDEEHRKVYITSKNLEITHFEENCEDFYFNVKDNTLYILYKNELKLFKMVSKYKLPFKLIDEYVVYKEAEDEFDESDDSFSDFPKI